MGQALAVLLVADREEDAEIISHCLIRGGYEPQITRVETEGEFRGALGAGKWGLILCEYCTAHFGCETALASLRSGSLDIPFIAITGAVNEETVLKLIRAGADDYVLKSNMERLRSTVDRAIREGEGRRDRKRLESQLHQAMKMEAIGRLAGGVAHDFNNLLTVIAGCAQLALLDDNPARAGLEEILLAADRASGLTRQLLAFSRLQALEPRVFDINQLVRDMEKLLRRLIGEDIKVVSRIAEQPLMVKADPGQIEQVVLNLAVNSRDAMPRGGKITLSTFPQLLDGASATLYGLPAGEYYGFAVSDTGTGISEEDMGHIFEPFFTTKAEGTGTGLGLATAYGIVQQSGGAIHAQSEQGKGTTMTVLLPASAVKVASVLSPALQPTGGGTETVLIAEDDDTVLRLVSRSLAASGFQVIEANSGEAALEKLHAQGPAGVDALITDVVMPGISGTVLATRAAELLPKLKILFMSGYTEDVIRHHGVLRENVAYLQKPFAPSELVRKVRQLIDPEKKGATGKD